jgi:hypothetical protein
MHTEHYTRPRLQRHVVRVLWMVPIYSVDAWLALRFVDARVYLDPVRECYEAYAIYSFYAFLVSFLEDELGDVDAYLAAKPPVPHLRFVKALGLGAEPWPMGAPFLYEVKKGVANYVIARPLCTALAALADALGVYGDGQILRPDRLYPYLALFVNFSQAWALYCLVLFYKAFAPELAPIRPLAKFVCIKAVVFLTFWQGLGLHVLGALGLLPRDEQVTTYGAADVAEGYQDFLICAEMFAASVAHAWAFSYRDYRDGGGGGGAAARLPASGDFLSNLRAMFDLRDVARDVRGVVEDHLATAAHAAGEAGGAVAGAGAAVPRAIAKAGGAVLASAAAAAKPPARGIYQHLVGGRGVGGEHGDEAEAAEEEEEEEDEGQGAGRDDDDEEEGGGGGGSGGARRRDGGAAARPLLGGGAAAEAAAAAAAAQVRRKQ